MSSQGVGVDEVVRAIQNANMDVPAGRIEQGPTEQLVRVEGKIKDPAGFNRIIVARRAKGPVYLSEVADVVDGEREADNLSRINGKPGISVNVLKVQDANIVEVGDGVKKAAAALNKELPSDVKLEIVYADVEWIEKALHGVKVTIVEGALLTIFIVFLFLHSWRSTIITGLTLPISVIATFTAVYMFGFTLNFITLMALSLCIGLLIDDAIVVRENIVRHIGMGKDHYRAAREGTDEIGLAVMATTFAIVAVFVPVAFMKGIIGRFFFQFGITVAVAVLVSLFVSFTLDPMLSAVWRDPAETRFKYAPWLGRVMTRIEHGVEKAHVVYGKLLEWALGNRKKVLALAFAIFVSSFFILPLVGTEFFPDSDEGRTSFRITTPVGSSLAYTDAKARQVEEVVRTYPEVEMMVANVGTWEGRNVARVDVRLSEKDKRPNLPVKDFEKKVRDKIRAIPGIELAVGYNRPIWINLLGPSPEGLEDLTNEILAKMAKIKGITDLESSLKAQNPAITMKVNNELASDLGLTVSQIGAAVRPFVAGDVISHWLAPDGQNYDVNVQLPKSGRRIASDLGELYVTSARTNADGTPMLIPLRQVVEFKNSTSPQIIKRQELQRRVGLYAERRRAAPPATWARTCRRC
jgi:multidrug efflux pump subunit AcrB